MTSMPSTMRPCRPEEVVVSAEEDTAGREAVAVHRRTIEFEAYDEGDSLSVTGRLRDERPWAPRHATGSSTSMTWTSPSPFAKTTSPSRRQGHDGALPT